MTHSYPPSLTVKLDPYSKLQIRKIQSVTHNAYKVAVLLSTVDIMKIFTKNPLKTIKRVSKHDWDKVVEIASTMSSFSKKRVRDIAFTTSMHYDRGSELYDFWYGIAYAFDK